MDRQDSTRNRGTNLGSIRAVAFALATLTSACAALPEDGATEQSAENIVVCGHGTVAGLDVSSWDGTIDWTAVRSSGRQFAIARVADGMYVDTTFDHHWTAMRAAGLIRGAYQYFRPALDPTAQADLFLRHIGTLGPGDLPPTLDVETADGVSTAQIVAHIRTWVNRVQAATGRVPMIYTGLYFWQDSVGSRDFAGSPLWIAQYGPTCPDIPAPWTNWAFFQDSDHGTVPGLTSSVDTDRFNGTLDDLRALAGVGSTPTDAGTTSDSGAHDAGSPQQTDAGAHDAMAIRDTGTYSHGGTGGSGDSGTTDGNVNAQRDASASDGARGDDASRGDAQTMGGCTAMPHSTPRSAPSSLLALTAVAAFVRRARRRAANTTKLRTPKRRSLLLVTIMIAAASAHCAEGNDENDAGGSPRADGFLGGRDRGGDAGDPSLGSDANPADDASSYPSDVAFVPANLPDRRTYDQDRDYIGWTGPVSYVTVTHRDDTSLPASEGGTSCQSGCTEQVTRIGDGGSIWGNFADLSTFRVQLLPENDPGVGQFIVEACDTTIVPATSLQNPSRVAGANNFPNPAWSVPTAGACTWRIRAVGGFVDFRALDPVYRTDAVPPTVALRVNDSHGPVVLAEPADYQLTWTSTNAVSCVTSGAWTGGVANDDGRAVHAQVHGSYTYNITCSNSLGSASDAVTVVVEAPPS